MPKPSEEAIFSKAASFLEGKASPDIQDIMNASPVEIPREPVDQAVAFLKAHFTRGEHINIVRKWDAESRSGYSFSTHVAEQFCDSLTDFRLLGHPGGLLVRVNPVTPTGTGKKGWHKDVDVTAFRSTVIENDTLPIEQQLAVLAHLPLPIASMVLSGGKSIHAVVRVVAEDLAAYKALSRWLASRLAWLGFDVSTTNPSRLTRLPGAARYRPAEQKTTRQKLIYLNPNPTSKSILN